MHLIYPVAAEKWIVRVDENGALWPAHRRCSGSVMQVARSWSGFPRLLADPHFTLEVVLIREEEVRRHDDYARAQLATQGAGQRLSGDCWRSLTHLAHTSETLRRSLLLSCRNLSPRASWLLRRAAPLARPEADLLPPETRRPRRDRQRPQPPPLSFRFVVIAGAPRQSQSSICNLQSTCQIPPFIVSFHRRVICMIE